MRRRGGLNFYRRKKIVNPLVIREILIWILGIGITAFVAFVLVFCIGLKTSIIGDSMKPTLYNGQEIYINRIAYYFTSPKRGDVIVFTPAGNTNTHYYVKRVIGLPGETIQIRGGKIYIDDVLYEEDTEVFDLIEDAGIAENEITLAKGEYFVLGDNRNNSEDSRSANIGVISKENILGKAWLHMACEEDGMGLIE